MYNKTSGQVEAIPFTTKRFYSNNPVHIQYAHGEVNGLVKDSTLIIEGRTTLQHEQLTDPIGNFSEDNWVKAAAGMVYQSPFVSYAFDNGITEDSTYKFLLGLN